MQSNRTNKYVLFDSNISNRVNSNISYRVKKKWIYLVPSLINELLRKMFLSVLVIFVMTINKIEGRNEILHMTCSKVEYILCCWDCKIKLNIWSDDVLQRKIHSMVYMKFAWTGNVTLSESNIKNQNHL